ncbi:MAG TPA: DUF2723 domain-containing protein, partial [bacterium]|nr:DUF2723 domain-containing protein [bacterium]
MLIPVFLFLFVLETYLLTHCATFNINDSGETIMVCDLLTISHSPGYPLHTLLGHVFCLLPIGKPMLRVTFCSMLTATIAIVIVYWMLKMMFKGIFSPADDMAPAPQASPGGVVSESPGASRSKAWLWEVPALCGALLFAFSYQHWFQAGGAKGGIYTLNTLLSASMLFLFFKMRERGWFVKSVLMMGFVLGLSMAHHWPNLAVMVPSFAWFFLASQKRVPLQTIIRNTLGLRPFDLWENLMDVVSAFGLVNIVRGVISFCLSVSVYLYLPIRATQDPLVNWWNPQTAGRLWGTVMREGYKGVGDMRGWTTMDRDLKRFWLHAHHQFGDYFTYIIFLMAIWGLVWLWQRKQWATAVGFALFGGGVFSGIILFNNPLEGYQWTIDNFFSPVFLTVSVFAACGVAGLCQWVAQLWPEAGLALPRAYANGSPNCGPRPALPC